MSGRYRFLEVHGEPGVGKTRLLDVVAREAQARRYLSLAGRADEFERHVPFGLIVDALDDHLASMDPKELEWLGASASAELAHVFPALTRFSADSRGGLQEERSAHIGRFVRCLAE